MDTIGCAEEIDILDVEIKQLSRILKEKRERISELRDGLNTWLEKTGENAVKHKGKVIYKITRPKPSKLTKKEKEENAMEFLSSIGVSDSKYVLEKLKDVQRGDPEEHTQIFIDDEKTYQKKMEREKKKRTRKNSGR